MPLLAQADYSGARIDADDMTEFYTNAEEMARLAGLANGKAFRSRLRACLPEFHERGNWRVVVGGPKHQAMARELAALVLERGNR